MCYVPRWICNVNWWKQERYNLFPLSYPFTAKYSALKCHKMTNDGKPQKLLDLSDTVSSLQKQTKNPGKHAVVYLCRFHNMLSVSYWFCCLSAKTKHERSGLEWIGWIILAGCIVKCHFVGIIIFHCQHIVLLW